MRVCDLNSVCDGQPDRIAPDEDYVLDRACTTIFWACDGAVWRSALGCVRCSMVLILSKYTQPTSNRTCPHMQCLNQTYEGLHKTRRPTRELCPNCGLAPSSKATGNVQTNRHV